jgi:hypothetical protein
MESRTTIGIVLLVIGFLGMIAFFPMGRWGMMGYWGGMMGYSMWGFGGVFFLVALVFEALFLGVFFMGLYLVWRSAQATEKA